MQGSQTQCVVHTSLKPFTSLLDLYFLSFHWRFDHKYSWIADWVFILLFYRVYTFSCTSKLWFIVLARLRLISSGASPNAVAIELRKA